MDAEEADYNLFENLIERRLRSASPIYYLSILFNLFFYFA